MYAGVDTHKDTLAVAVIDGVGRVVVQTEVPNDVAGFARLLALVGKHQVERIGIEGSGNFGWPAATYLIENGVDVVEVPPLLTSRELLSSPGQGKTDPVDSITVARITAREALPQVRPMHGPAADLRVLTEYRDQLVAERTALANRVHTDLRWLRPGYQQHVPHLTAGAQLRAALALVDGVAGVRVEVTRKRAEGKTSREALRCLKRRLSDVLYRTMRADQAAADAPTTDTGTPPASLTA